MPEHEGNRIALSQRPEMELLAIEVLDSIFEVFMETLHG
jgi:hypothetical protein